MHDAVLALLAAHLDELEDVRRQLAAARRVRPGERCAALQRSIVAGERFVTEASRLLAGIDGPAEPFFEGVHVPAVTAPRDSPADEALAGLRRALSHHGDRVPAPADVH